MRNLVDNAIRYTPAGGRIDLAIAVRPDQVEWGVADTGPGIPEAERQRVFDPFYRVLGSTETGTGLGLAIVQTLATRMGARVRLEHPPGRRTAGHRELPFAMKPHRATCLHRVFPARLPDFVRAA
jgi:two-component system OmpR family sensor kinase